MGMVFKILKILQDMNSTEVVLVSIILNALIWNEY
jgi:hypothetical protein